MAAGRIMALLPRHLTGGPEVGAGSDRPGSSPNDARHTGETRTCKEINEKWSALNETHSGRIIRGSV